MSYRVPITKEKMIALQEEIKPFVLIFDLLDEQIAVTDENANLIYVNHAAEEETGRSAADMIGKTPGDLWGGNMPQEFYEKMWKTIKTDKKTFVGDVRNRKADGTAYWSELQIFPILDKDRNIRVFIAIEPNVSERKQSELDEEQKHEAAQEMIKFMANQEVTMIDLKKQIEGLRAELRAKG